MTNKVKYIVTDPCYVLSEEVWDSCTDNFDNFEGKIQECLVEETRFPAYVSDTGVGDWTNKLSSSGEGVISPDFFADSGMVCVCRLTPTVEERLKKVAKGGVAMFQSSTDISVDFTEAEDYSMVVVHIKDNVTREIFTSMESEEQEETFTLEGGVAIGDLQYISTGNLQGLHLEKN